MAPQELSRCRKRCWAAGESPNPTVAKSRVGSCSAGGISLPQDSPRQAPEMLGQR